MHARRRWPPGKDFVYAILLVIALTVIVSLGYYAWHMAAASTKDLINRFNAVAAESMRTILDHEFDHRIAGVVALARDPDFLRQIEQREAEAIRGHLDVLVNSHSNIVRAFVTDSRGTLWSDYPLAAESIGENFSERDWFIGLSRQWTPYVSNVYRRHADPQILLIAFAAPIVAGDAVIGTLVYQMHLDGLRALLQRATPQFAGHIYLIDPMGNAAVHSNAAPQKLVQVTFPPLGATTRYSDSVTGDTMLTTALVNDRGWTVVTQQSEAEALAPLTALGWRLLSAGGVASIVLLALIYMLVGRTRRIAHLNVETDALNQQLSAEAQVRRRKYEALLASLPGMVYECANDRNRTMHFASEWCDSLTGYRADEFIDNRVVAYGDLIVEGDQDLVWQEVQRAVARKEIYSFSYRILSRDDTLKWVWEQGRPVFDDDGNLETLQGYVHDVSEQVTLQRQVEQADRMSSLGNLAGGIAHDFNNVLAVILGYTSFLLEEIKDEELRRDVAEIGSAAERAADLIQQLLAFCRSQKLEPKLLDINDVVSDMNTMLQRLIGEDIELTTRLEANSAPIRFDKSQLEQIIINLAVNARDAMPRGGHLVIQTEDLEVDDDYVRQHPEARAGAHVVVAVSDNGLGMEPDVMDHIFEPFFTTKSERQGTGLGLSTVFGIVKQAGGNIFCYSEPGRGTTFKIYLPRGRDTIATETIDPVVDTQSRAVHRVLVVEDDERLRKLVVRMLTQAGISADHTGSPEHAIELCTSQEYDALLTDIVMPEMDGSDLANAVRTAVPDIRIVFMSGYTDDAIANHGIVDPDATYLEKPFNANQLVDAITRV